MTKEQLIIFDTTLRDGEQSPGVTLTADEKVEIARALSRLGVDVCEAGFPIASPGDFDAVQRIAREVGPLTVGRKTGKPMVIAGLARAVEGDIQRAYDAIKDAPLFRIHTFLATSDIHLKHKLKIDREECVRRAVAAVKFARSLGCNDVEFSPEDAGRSDPDFLCQVLGEVIKAGATTVNIPDTVGYNMPEEYGKMMNYLIENTPGGNTVVWSTHCHNDLGLATANTLAGVLNGARQVEVTINGIGERAGNTSLEEIVMSVYTHPDFFPVYSTIDTYQIYSTSQLVTRKSGMVIQPNKAIVGANAFAHESGIHQDGVLKNKLTYEIIQPEVIGLPSVALVLGKHSGRNAFRTRIQELLGEESPYLTYLQSNPSEFEKLFNSFKKLADSKKSGVTEQDFYALIDDQLNLKYAGDAYTLKSLQVFSGSDVLATATVTIIDSTKQKQNGSSESVDGTEITDAAIGHGPVHAIFRAINRLTNLKNVLASYEVRAVTGGSDSLGKVIVRIHEDNSDSDDVPRLESLEINGVVEGSVGGVTKKKETYLGNGADEDILIASAKAYINAVNKMKIAQERKRAVQMVDVGAPESRNVDV